jgi:hypothetical protein
MTQATTLRFSQFLIQIGNGASPETFASPCGLNSRGFSRSAATNDTNVGDCDDPDAPTWLDRDVVSLSGALSGAGVVADEDFDTWNAWFESGTSKNVKIKLGTRVWVGAAILSKLDVTGSRGKRTEFSASIDTDGKLTLQ